MKTEMAIEMITKQNCMKKELRQRMVRCVKRFFGRPGPLSVKIVRRLASLPSGERKHYFCLYASQGSDITGIFPILWERGQQVRTGLFALSAGIMKRHFSAELLSAMEPG